MATPEQPLKKRRIYDSFQPDPQPSPPRTPPPPSQEEIAQKKRNRNEIRKVHDEYRRIKYAISQNDSRLIPDLEKAYLSLLSASRGCTSAQRIVSDLIPRYASYCPSALESVVEAVTYMYSCSLGIINKKEDIDGVALDTAKACVLGVADICQVAAANTLKSSLLRGISSAVFRDVLSFFISSFNCNDILGIMDKEMVEMQESCKLFSDLKQKLSDKDGSGLRSLSKIQVLCLLWILFTFPKNTLAACFELIKIAEKEGDVNKGYYFLTQMTRRFSNDVLASSSSKTSDEHNSCTDSTKTNTVGDKICTMELDNDVNYHPGETSPILKSCLLGMIIVKYPSLRSWILMKYKKSCDGIDSEFASAVESIFQASAGIQDMEENQGDSDEENTNPSRYTETQYQVPRVVKKHETSTSKTDDGSHDHSFPESTSAPYLKRNSSVGDQHSNTVSSHNSEGVRTLDCKYGDSGDVTHGKSSIPLDLLSTQFPSPSKRNTFDRTDSLQGRNQATKLDANSSENINWASPRHVEGAEYPPNQFERCSDGDPEAMDIFSASKHLLLEFVARESESYMRYQFERFGPIGQFMFSPDRGFALVEYRNIMDAIKAREYMRFQTPWCVKFVDVELASRYHINNVAVGFGPYVYVGNVSSQWAKDEIQHEIRKVVYGGPRMITDLTREGALLLKFENPEEALKIMMHLRRHRNEKNYHPTPLNAGLANVARSDMDGGMFIPPPHPVEMRMNRPGNMSHSFVGSPHAPMFPGSPADGYGMRASHLSSFISRLCVKYNIPPKSDSFVREEDRAAPTSTLVIKLPATHSIFIADDDVAAVCNLALDNHGSVIRISRVNMQIGCGWFVEFSSVDSACHVLKNFRGCPGMFFQVEFSSQPVRHQPMPYTTIPEGSTAELISPRMNADNHGMTPQNGQTFQSSWPVSASATMTEVGARINCHSSSSTVDPMRGGQPVSSATDQMWMYQGPGSSTASQGHDISQPQQYQTSQFMRPVYPPPNSSWDPHGGNQHMHLNPISPSVASNHPHNSYVAAPFLPASITPLAEIQGSSLQHEPMFPVPVMPPPLSSFPPPPQPHMQPPFLPSSPPLPHSMPPPPPPPPPPSSPPPMPPAVMEYPDARTSVQGLQSQWQGALSKSGVHYCTVYAQRVDSESCKYSSATYEPTEWPVKLDMTKRTDLRHVKSTFSSTPPQKREVCRLFPLSAVDQKGFQDFVSYLKQRDCAGVIKIPAVKSMWSRLLFILPYSIDLCSTFGITSDPSDCLFALVLPKETNFEWV